MSKTGLCNVCDGKKNRYGVCNACGRDVFFRNFLIIISILYTAGLLILNAIYFENMKNDYFYDLFAESVNSQHVKRVVTICVLYPIHLLWCYIYMIPMKRARKNAHNHAVLIGVLNFLFGGTIVGWIILLNWSKYGKPQELERKIEEKRKKIRGIEALIERSNDYEVQESFKADIGELKKELVQLEAEYEEYADLSGVGAETESCEEDILEMYLHELEERIAQLHEEGSYSEAAEEKILAEYSEEVQQMYAGRV